MTAVELVAPALRALELFLVGNALLAAIRATKYRGFPLDGRVTAGDRAIWGAVSVAIAIAAAASPVAGVGLALVAALLVVGLWLDALLFRVFTIELGPGGIGGVILGVLYRELAEMSYARRFFRENRTFAWLPVGAAVMLARPAVPPATAADLATAAPLVAYLIALAATGVARGARGRRDRGSIATFLVARPLPIPRGFTPRPEHAPLVSPAPRPPRRSPLHGRLRGANVLFVTLESVARDHLGDGGAVTPFLDRLAARAVRSRRHFCVSPTTNNAHLALYASRYLPDGAPGNVARLRDAGWRTVYVSAARTRRYGLRALLDAAGFDAVLDGDTLAPHPLDRGVASDYALVAQARLLVAELARAERWFAHVHTIDTHVPYRVIDGARFRRHDDATDRARFLNGIEETDFVVGELARALEAAGLAENTLIAVSSDHGQSFGEMGYWSHGSAITREQLDVPLIVHHPRLAAAEIAWSTHFDVLPTLLDLVGVDAPDGFGESILVGDRRAELLVWAGRPSRTTASNYGLVLGERKLMIDLALDRCVEMSWDDRDPRELSGDERVYHRALASAALAAHGLR